MNHCTNLSASWVAASLAFFLPLVATASDSDADGLDDSVETNTGAFVSTSNTGTDPNNSDTDGDGVPDGLEVTETTDPTNASNFMPFSVGMVGYFPFNENANDESGNTKHLTAQGNPVYVQGIRGSAILFDGIDDLAIRAERLVSATGYTWSGWFKIQTLEEGAYVHLIAQANSSIRSSPTLRISGDGLLIINAYKTSSAEFLLSEPTAEWMSVTAVVNPNGSKRLYVNGELKDEMTSTTSFGELNDNFVVGANYPFQVFSNLIADELRIYDRALSTNEVSALYQSEFTPPLPSLPVVNVGSFYEANPLESITISALPSSGHPTTFTYQWYLNGFAIPEAFGGTTSSFAINGISANEGEWRIEVSNSEGSSDSSFQFRVFVDADGDGLSDGREELVTFTNPNQRDSDDDGLSDFAEVNNYGTDPNNADSDEDGYLDGFEVSTGFNPNTSESTPDTTSSIKTAVEFCFAAAAGATYHVEASLALEQWETIESGIVGNGGEIRRLYSVRDTPFRAFRARRD